MEMRVKLRLFFDFFVGLSGVAIPILLIGLKPNTFPNFLEYLLLCVVSALSALWYVGFRSTMVSFEIAIFFFVTLQFGYAVGSFTAMLVILLVWLGKSFHRYLRRTDNPLNTLRTGFFNAGLYGVIYLVGGTVYKALDVRLLGAVIAMIAIILTNELIFVLREIIQGNNILEYLKKEALLSDFVELLVYPLGISLWLMYRSHGFYAIVPVLTVILVLSYIGHQYFLYHQELSENIKFMEKLNEIQGNLNRLTDPQEILDYALYGIAHIIPASFIAFRLLRKLSYLSGSKIYDGHDVRPLEEEEIDNMSWDLVFNVVQGDIILGEILIGVGQGLTRSHYSVLQNLISVINASLDRSIIYKESILDGLTGLYTRRFFEERIKSYIAQSKREKKPFSMILFDVDKLKYVNDTFGHLKGDELLVTFSKICMEYTRDSDLCARWGGDEFVVVLYGVGEREAERVARRISEEFENVKFTGLGGEFVATCTYACKEFDPEFPVTSRELFYLVDSILIAKKKGNK
ncbi:MAG: GGDEF domain-containing protein [bacterium]|nr:GGDEF domain-containing protein [bacterium]